MTSTPQGVDVILTITPQGVDVILTITAQGVNVIFHLILNFHLNMHSGLHQCAFSKMKLSHFVTNDLPEAQNLGTCNSLRELPFGSDPGPCEKALDQKIDISDHDVEKRLNKKGNKGPHENYM